MSRWDDGELCRFFEQEADINSFPGNPTPFTHSHL